MRGFFVRRGGSVLSAVILVGLVAGVAVVLVSLFGGDAFGLIEEGSGDSAYAAAVEGFGPASGRWMIPFRGANPAIMLGW